MLISACVDIDQMAVCIEFHQGSKPVKCVQSDVRHGLYGYLQLIVVRVEYDIRLPFLVHVAGVPQCIELCGQRFKWPSVQEGHTFRHLPCDESDQDKKPVEVEFVSLILRFPTI
jgi:hypothetical protein